MVGEIKNAAVFEEAAHNTAYAYAIAYPANAGAQGTHAAHDQVDFNSRLRGAIQGHDDVLVEQGIHLRDNTGRAAVTRVLGLAGDQPETALRQIKRRNQQGLVL